MRRIKSIETRHGTTYPLLVARWAYQDGRSWKDIRERLGLSESTERRYRHRYAADIEAARKVFASLASERAAP